MTLEQIGQKLKAARDGLGLSLSQIHERTKIPFNHLQAIDNGQSDDLPEPVYVSGFIKRYAECVGLNGQQLADQYREDIDGTPQTNGRFGFLARGIKEQAPMSSAPSPAYFNRPRIDQPPPNLMKSVPFYAFWIIVVLGLVIFLASRQQNMESYQQDPSVLALKDSAAKFNGLPAPNATTPETTQPVNTPSTPKPQSNDAHVVLSASQHVWVEVKSKSTDEDKFRGFLETGDRRDFQDPEGLDVIAGNAGSLTFSVDGKVQAFGQPGKRGTRTFLAKNAPTTASSEKAESKAANPTAKTSTTATTAIKKPSPIKKSVASLKDRGARRSDGMPSRYMPGESLGSGDRGIDVPYRYSE
jgi:cytoskeletal protein RodZ